MIDKATNPTHANRWCSCLRAGSGAAAAWGAAPSGTTSGPRQRRRQRRGATSGVAAAARPASQTCFSTAQAWWARGGAVCGISRLPGNLFVSQHKAASVNTPGAAIWTGSAHRPHAPASAPPDPRNQNQDEVSPRCETFFLEESATERWLPGVGGAGSLAVGCRGAGLDETRWPACSSVRSTAWQHHTAPLIIPCLPMRRVKMHLTAHQPNPPQRRVLVTCVLPEPRVAAVARRCAARGGSDSESERSLGGTGAASVGWGFLPRPCCQEPCTPRTRSSPAQPPVIVHPAAVSPIYHFCTRPSRQRLPPATN
jgi:hypothetical protein